MFEIEFNKSEIVTTDKPQSAKSVKQQLKQAEKALLRKEEASAIITGIGGIPAHGVSVDILCNGQSNAGGFYEVIRDQWGYVNHLCLATWIINRHYIDMLISDLSEGRLGFLTFILSNRMSQLGKGHAPNFNRLKNLLPQLDNASFRVANSHAKVYCMTNGADHITCSGSGNWSDNPRIENYILSNSKERFDFHKEWMTKLADG